MAEEFYHFYPLFIYPVPSLFQVCFSGQIAYQANNDYDTHLRRKDASRRAARKHHHDENAKSVESGLYEQCCPFQARDVRSRRLGAF